MVFPEMSMHGGVFLSVGQQPQKHMCVVSRMARARSSPALRAKTAYEGGGYEFHSHSGMEKRFLHASMTLRFPIPEYGVNCN